MPAAALELAGENIVLHGMEGRVNTMASDGFTALRGQPDRRYQLILSNPPYVSEAECAALPAEYRHEPLSGLVAGADGLDVAIPVLAEAGEFLSEDGILVLEVGASAARLQAVFADLPLIWASFEQGGDGVLVLPHADWVRWRARFCEAAAARSTAGRGD